MTAGERSRTVRISERRLDDARFSWYMASSARAMTASRSSSAGFVDQRGADADVQRRTAAGAHCVELAQVLAQARAQRVDIALACRWARATNSSPPMRATMSEPRKVLRSTSRGIAQRLVARQVAERVVDLLQAVQVHEEQRHGVLLAPRHLQRLLAELEEAAAIFQLRQLVDQRQVLGAAPQMPLRARGARRRRDACGSRPRSRSAGRLPGTA